MATKRLERDASEYYSEEYKIPIEIYRTNRKTIQASTEVHALVFQVPNIVPLFEDEFEEEGENRQIDINNHELLVGLIEEYAEKHKDKYQEREIIQYSTGRDLRRMTRDWASKMDIPDPKVNVYRVKGEYGHFRPNTDDESGTIVYSKDLLYFPQELAENVVVHELSHALEWYKIFMAAKDEDQAHAQWNAWDHHGKTFWDIFDTYMPDNARRSRELREMHADIFNEQPPDTVD